MIIWLKQQAGIWHRIGLLHIVQGDDLMARLLLSRPLAELLLEVCCETLELGNGTNRAKCEACNECGYTDYATQLTDEINHSRRLSIPRPSLRSLVNEVANGAIVCTRAARRANAIAPRLAPSTILAGRTTLLPRALRHGRRASGGGQVVEPVLE